jgi:hypothetical protein
LPMTGLTSVSFRLITTEIKKAQNLKKAAPSRMFEPLMPKVDGCTSGMKSFRRLESQRIEIPIAITS